jgi:hypothetical protein
MTDLNQQNVKSRRRKSLACAGLVLLAVVVVAGSAQAQTGSNQGSYARQFCPVAIAGQVTTQDGLPVMGAAVRTPEGHAALTGSDGTYLLFLEVAGIYTLVAQQGDLSLTQTIEVVGDETSPTQLNFMLPSANAPTLSAHILVNGDLKLELSGQPNTAYTIETSGTLSGWTAIFTGMTDADGKMEFTDTTTGDFPQRFYRSRGP